MLPGNRRVAPGRRPGPRQFVTLADELKLEAGGIAAVGDRRLRDVG